MSKKKKKAPKQSELLGKQLRKTSSMGGAFSSPPSEVPDARLNPSPSETYTPPQKQDKRDTKESRRKTKGILFRMTPELYETLCRASETDEETKTITRLLTRGALAEIQRLKEKHPEGFKPYSPKGKRGDSVAELERMVLSDEYLKTK